MIRLNVLRAALVGLPTGGSAGGRGASVMGGKGTFFG
jgi:hypothetical protein